MTDTAPPPSAGPSRRHRRALRWTLVAVGVVLALFALLAVGARYGLVSGPGRDLVSGFVNGKKLGRYGAINVYGLSGDVWSDFTLERVTVTDAEGVWLEARDVRVDWNSRPLLFGRTFKADLISAEVVRVIRRPQLSPDLNEPPSDLPLNIHVERLQTRLELMEGFSDEYGRWAVGAAAHVNRRGSKSGALVLRSLTNPGDFGRANVQFGGGKDLRVVAQAVERRGGTLAGALGFSPDQPFTLDVDARGETVQGRFHAVLRSGELTPLSADGRWNASGATARGRALLSASELTRPFVARIGLEPRFGLAARRAERGRYAVAWFFGADNLQSRAFGFFDPRTRESDESGVRISLSTNSLTRLLNQPVAGATRYEAVWKNDGAAWTLDGRLDARNVDVAGYDLARLTGPVDVAFRNGRFDVDTELAGAGGAGSGVVGALLGRAPTATASLARLPDGRLLLERIQARGAALRVDGSGARGLGGGLSFRGEAAVTDLGRVRPGARGSLGGTVRASQSGRAGWRLAFDARGNRFATGLGQLDRLLGARPRLRGEGSLADGLVRITRATLDGAAGSASARGQIRPGGRLALLLDWRARGPFAAGPVEIAGNARGSGSLTGTLAAPAANLRANFEAIDLPNLPLRDAAVTLRFAKDARGFDGAFGLAAQSPYGQARARSDFAFAPDGVRLSGLDLDAGGVRAEGAVALRNGAPSSADLTFAAGPGAFLTAGSARGTVRLTEGGGGTPAVIDVVGENLVLRGSDARVRSIRLQGSGTLARLPFTVSTEVVRPQPIVFNGNGVYSRERAAQVLTLAGQGRVRRAAFSTNRPIVLRLAGDTRSIDLDVAAVGGRLTATATQGANTVEARTVLQNVSLGAFGDYEGLIDGTATLSGRGQRLEGVFQARVTDARTLDSPRDLAVDADLNGRLLDDRLQIATTANAGGNLRATAEAVLPVVASAAPLRLAVARERPLSGRYEVAGQIRPVWDLLLGGERSVAGVVDSRGTLGGTLNDLTADGALTLRQGRFEDAGTGLVLANLSADARFDRDSVELQSLRATDESGGTVSGQGRASLVRSGGSDLRITLNRFQLLDSDLGTARASGPVTVTRDAQGRVRIGGDLQVVEAEIAPEPPTPSGVVRMDVVEINRPERLVERDEQRRAEASGPPIALDVRIRAPNEVFVRGRGLDVELSLDATVRGTVARPDLDGRARVVRGDFSFAGKRFAFDERGTILLDENPRNIRLDLRAVNETPTLTAAVVVRGTAAEPEIELVSTPDLPDDEILAQVLFGRSASQLSGLEAAQLAAGVAALSGGGGFDVFGNLREFAGLDRLSFGADASGALTVAGGRYISDDVYLELIGGGVEGPAVQVEWRPRRNLAVLSRLAGQGGTRLAVRWRREFR